MAALENLKQMLLRTPLERPMQRLRRLAEFPRRRRHPELAEVYAEQDRIEAVLERLLKPDSNCLDVGCHLGSFLSLILRRSPRGRHMAFEALPDKAARLKKKFPEVEIVQAAVAEAPGEIDFFRNLSRSGFSGPEMTAGARDVVEKIKVRSERLDDVVPLDRKVEFLKIDVEGAELSVLKGARSLVDRSRPVVLFECTKPNLERAQTSPQAVFDFINDSLRMRIFLVKDWLAGGAPLAFEPFRKAMWYPFQAYNFLAVPEERRVEQTGAVGASR
jgi:FkbM family methyltransferase